jgi:ABC-type oligopeptide transport system substrate-binding subunit
MRFLCGVALALTLTAAGCNSSSTTADGGKKGPTQSSRKGEPATDDAAKQQGEHMTRVIAGDREELLFPPREQNGPKQ